MNSYSLDLTGGGDDHGWASKNIPNLRKAIGYAVLFGKNLRIDPMFLYNVESPNIINYGSISRSRACGVLSFDLDFSLSNLQQFWDSPLDTVILAQQMMYDTACQSVKEFVDKPYAVKGYLAITNGFDATKDMDNYVKFSYWSLRSNQVEPIYVGICNSSKTDFYTPFSDSLDEQHYGVTLMDINSMNNIGRNG